MAVSGPLVVDASVVLKWYLRDESLVDKADAVLDALSSGEARLSAPAILRYEVANGLLVASRLGRFPTAQILPQFTSFLSMGIAVSARDEPALMGSAVRMALELSVAFYDSLYLATARRLASQFVTADRQLYERVTRKLPWVVWLGEVA